MQIYANNNNIMHSHLIMTLRVEHQSAWMLKITNDTNSKHAFHFVVFVIEMLYILRCLVKHEQTSVLY